MRYRILIICCVLCSVFLSGFGIEFRSAQGDEFGSIWLSSQDNASYVIKKIQETDVHPPTYYLFLHYLGKVFGYGDLAMRLPSVVFVCLSLIIAWGLIGMLAQRSGQKEKLVIFLLCATAPALWVLGSVARHYSLGMFLGLLSNYIYLRWFREGGVGLLTGTILTTSSLFYIHYLLAPLIALGQGLHYLVNIRGKNGKEILIWVGSQVSMVIMSLPIFFWSIFPVISGKSNALANTLDEGVSGVKALPIFFSGQIYTALSGGVPYPWHFWVTIPLAGAFLWVIRKGLKERIFWSSEAICLLFIPFVLLAVIISVMVPVTGYLYGLFRVGPLIALFWIYLGIAMVRVKDKRTQRSIIIIIMLCNFYSLFLYDFNLPSMAQSPPIREICGYIEDTTPKKRSIIILNPFYHGWADPIKRYLPVYESRILTDGGWGITIDSCKSLVNERHPDGIWMIHANRFSRNSNLVSDWLIGNGYVLYSKKDFQRQSAYDIWAKDLLKSFRVLNFTDNPSHKYILTAEYFARRN